MRETREAIPPEDRIRLSAVVSDRLFALPEVRAARTISLFSSFGSEIDTSLMIGRAHAEGRRIVLPFLDRERMEVAEHGPADELVRSSYGAAEPLRRNAVDPGEVDAVALPGLAFDRKGRRLGYGGGFYDRWLSRLRPDAALIGICFASQLVERVPAGSSDVRVHVVVTDQEVIRVRGEEPGPPL